MVMPTVDRWFIGVWFNFIFIIHTIVEGGKMVASRYIATMIFRSNLLLLLYEAEQITPWA